MKQEEVLGNYKLVLGLEIHVHIKTKHKMFCRCDAQIYNSEPNTHTCPVCLGMPGALPVPNLSAVKATQLLGKALNSKLNQYSRFDRKHYFYPDLPKGYQISQYKMPLCLGGYFLLSNGFKVELDRIHLEEDTAKSIHEQNTTLLDFNMSGMPLIEIVTKPIFTDISNAVEFCKRIQKIIRDLDLGEADMEKGQMRLEPNISVRTLEMEKKDVLPKYKVEIKNINSFKFMEKAVLAEIKRQKYLLDLGEMPIQENRGFNEAKGDTISQRKKEEAHDYRYFPEPDIPPMVFDAKYFDEINKDYMKRLEKSPQMQKNILISKFKVDQRVKEKLEEDINITKEHLEKIQKLIDLGFKEKNVINKFINKIDIREMDLNKIIEILEGQNSKISDEKFLENIIKKVIDENSNAIVSYKNGKENALQFLVGMVMKETKGQADAIAVKNILITKINQ